MSLILELPREFEVELLAHWQRTGLIEDRVAPASDRSRNLENSVSFDQFRLPTALLTRLHDLLDRQDTDGGLSKDERLEAEGLVELAEFLSLLRLRSLTAAYQS